MFHFSSLQVITCVSVLTKYELVWNAYIIMFINYVTSLMKLLLNNDNNFNLDSLVSKSSSDLVIHLVALRCTASNLSMLRLVWGFQVSHEYTNKGLKRLQYSVFIVSMSCKSQQVLLTNTKTPLALAVILSTCRFHESSPAVNNPKSSH